EQAVAIEFEEMTRVDEHPLALYQKVHPGILVHVARHLDDGVPAAVGGQAAHRTPGPDRGDGGVQVGKVLGEARGRGGPHAGAGPGAGPGARAASATRWRGTCPR